MSEQPVIVYIVLSQAVWAICINGHMGTECFEV